jgi:uncharacterized protein (TIGR02271 family)
MQGALTQLRSWKLDHKNEDIRGWALRDPDGHVLGTVGELIVDTDSKHVTQVVLADGKRYSAHDVLIGDHDLTLAGVSTRAAANARAEAEAERARRELAAASAPLGKKESLKEKISEKKETLKEKLHEEKEALKGKLQSEEKTVKEKLHGDKETFAITDTVIPIVEEEIRVGKRQVDAGGMHVESKIVAQPVDEDVHLREETVKIERRKVDQPLTLADADARLHEGVVELRATAEEAVVEKRAHVVEEILLKKEATEHVEHVRDTVRHTEVDISEIPGKVSAKTTKGISP